MHFLDILICLLFVLSLVITLVPFVRSQKAWVKNCEFPRIQVFVVTTIGLIYIALRIGWDSWPVFVAMVPLLLYQGCKILPYTRLGQSEVLKHTTSDKQEDSLKLITANVKMDNRDATGILEQIQREDPDIVLLMETDQWWIDQVKSLNNLYPYRELFPLGNTYGMALYSKYALNDTKVNFLVDEEVPSIDTWLTLPSGEKIRVFCVHPKPPLPSVFKEGNKDDSDKETELIIIAKKASTLKNPVLVIGDLNDVGWSYTTTLFQNVSTLLDPRKGRGMYNTFHADYFFLRYCLDHIFVSKEFLLKDIRVLPYIGSDHFPTFAHFFISNIQ